MNKCFSCGIQKEGDLIRGLWQCKKCLKLKAQVGYLYMDRFLSWETREQAMELIKKRQLNIILTQEAEGATLTLEDLSDNTKSECKISISVYTDLKNIEDNF